MKYIILLFLIPCITLGQKKNDTIHGRYPQHETNFPDTSWHDNYNEAGDSIYVGNNIAFNFSRKKSAPIHKKAPTQKHAPVKIKATHAKHLYYYMWITGNNQDGWTGGEDVVWLNKPPVDTEINKYKCCDHHILIVKKFSSMADEKKWHLENKNMLDVIFDQYMQSWNTEHTQ